MRLSIEKPLIYSLTYVLYHLFPKHNLAASSLRCYSAAYGSLLETPRPYSEHNITCEDVDSTCWKTVIEINGVVGLVDGEVTIRGCADKSFRDALQMKPDECMHDVKRTCEKMANIEFLKYACKLFHDASEKTGFKATTCLSSKDLGNSALTSTSAPTTASPTSTLAVTSASNSALTSASTSAVTSASISASKPIYLEAATSILFLLYASYK